MPTETEAATAVGYIRLSQDGKSLARQRRDIEDYASKHGTELVTVYDEGKRSSGFDTDRPKYTALREHVADGGVDTVIVPIDTFSGRNSAIQCPHCEREIAARHRNCPNCEHPLD